MSDTINTIYTGASDFGQWTALLSAFLATLIGLLAIGVGIYLLVEDSLRTQKVQGTVESVTCSGTTSSTTSSSTSSGSCLIDVRYVVQRKTFTRKFAVDNPTTLQKGSTVTLFVDPKDPQDNVVLDIGNANNNAASIAGGVLIGVGLLILIVGWIVYYLTRRYKFFAAAEGVGEAANIISNAV
jgi:hypothetical protein